jgi:hypothetical protein
VAIELPNRLEPLLPCLLLPLAPLFVDALGWQVSGAQAGFSPFLE